MREIVRAKVYRELLVEKEGMTGTRGIIYHPPVYRRNSLQMLFNLLDGKPSFLPRPRARSVPRRHSLTTKFLCAAPFPSPWNPLLPFSPACPFTGLPTRRLSSSPFGSLSRRILHFFSRVMRFRVFAFIWIPPNALSGKWLVAGKTIMHHDSLIT